MFWKRKEKSNIGIFIIHGFISTSKMSFGYLTEKLIKNKIENISMPILQGHEKPEDIPNFDYKKCLEQVETEFLMFRGKYPVVYLVGFSMGGAIASYLAAKHSPDKLVLVAPALKYGGKKIMKNNIVNFLKNRKDKDDSESDVQIESFVDGLSTEKDDEHKQEFTERIKNVSLNTMMNFSKLVSTINKTLKDKKIECPTRIYQSDEDELVPVEAALLAFDKVYDDDKKLSIITNSPHNVLKSGHKEEIVKEILYFLYGKKKVK